MKFVLKIGFVLAKRVEQRYGHSHDMLCACLHDLGWVQKGLGGTGSPTSIETAPLPLWGLYSGTVGSFQLGKVFTGQRALAGCGQGYEPQENLWKNP